MNRPFSDSYGFSVQCILTAQILFHNWYSYSVFAYIDLIYPGTFPFIIDEKLTTGCPCFSICHELIGFGFLKQMFSHPNLKQWKGGYEDRFFKITIFLPQRAVFHLFGAILKPPRPKRRGLRGACRSNVESDTFDAIFQLVPFQKWRFLFNIKACEKTYHRQLFDIPRIIFWA